VAIWIKREGRGMAVCCLCWGFEVMKRDLFSVERGVGCRE